MPSKQSVWSDQGIEREEPSSTDRFGLDREPTTLRIRESQSLPAELFAQGSILLLQVFNHVLLVAIYPSGEEQHQELQLQSVH
jgi:hypothetical protein